MQLYKSGRPKEFNPSKNSDFSQVPSAKGEYRIIGEDRSVQYIGYTNDLNRRLHEHIRSGKFKDKNTVFAYQIADGRASRDSLAQHETHKIREHAPELNKRAGGAGRPFKRRKTV